jgi:tetratricopeptide (TPR) repeat protein
MGKQRQKQQPAQPSLKGYPAWFTNQRWHVWGLFVLSFLLYANTLGHDYALDDAIVIYDNMFVEQGVSGIPGILSKDTFFGFFKEEGKAALVAGGRYRPFSLVLFALEMQLFGDNSRIDHQLIGHLLNAVFYGLTVVVLYLTLLQLFRPSKNQVQAYFIALATCVLFAVHPIHTEVVANIKGRDEILALLGSLGALYFAMRAYREKQLIFQVAAAGVFFLGLMSKENAIMFIFILPLALYFFTKAKPGQMITQSLPLLAAAVLFLLIRFSVLGFGFSEPTTEMMNNPFVKVVNGEYLLFTAQERLATVMFSLGKYLQLLFFPLTLSHDYYPRAVGVLTFGDWQALLSTLLYLALGVYALVRLPKRDPMSFAILFYLVTLAIVSNLFFPVGTHLAERLLFMPSVGFCLAIALLAYRWGKRGAPKGKVPAFRRFKPAIGVLAVLAILFSVRTVARNPVWKDNYTLFLTDVEHTPNSAKLRNAAGGELVTQSTEEKNEAKRQLMLQQAVGHLKEAIRIHPQYKNAYLLLGNAHNYLKDFDQSIAYYQKALELDPNYEQARTNLGITYKDAGRYYGEEKQQVQKALQYLQKAYEILPQEYEVVRLMGVAYGISGNSAKAVEFFTKATEIDPDNATAWFDLGTAHLNAGNQALGTQYRNKAIQMDPSLQQRLGGQ